MRIAEILPCLPGSWKNLCRHGENGNGFAGPAGNKHPAAQKDEIVLVERNRGIGTHFTEGRPSRLDPSDRHNFLDPFDGGNLGGTAYGKSGKQTQDRRDCNRPK